MSRILVFKLLRDLRWPLFFVALLLILFQLIWALVTHRITQDLVKEFEMLGIKSWMLERVIFSGPGKLIQAVIGGDSIRLDRAIDMLSVGYVHPVSQAIFCIWAIGRAAGALAGEIDRGTMELLLAQPIPRRQIVAAHLAVDLVTIPLLCLAMILGTWLGVQIVGLEEVRTSRFWGGLTSVAALMFAISGYTLAISAIGRSRTRILSFALGVTLVQFLINLIGQLWPPAAPLRPYVVFNYFEAQRIVLNLEGNPRDAWLGLTVLAGVGAAGYVAAFLVFTRRDLPAPL